MPRKRKSDQQTPAETSTAIAEPPAAETPTVDAAPPAAEPPAVEPASAETIADGQRFAGKVEKKKWVPAPDPFGIAKDNVAGVRLFESERDQQMAIMFGDGRPEDKPSQAVIDRMKAAGYRWNPADRIWTFPVMPESAMRTRIDAEKLYQEVRQMIRQEKGIEESPEIPF